MFHYFSFLLSQPSLTLCWMPWWIPSFCCPFLVAANKIKFALIFQSRKSFLISELYESLWLFCVCVGVWVCVCMCVFARAYWCKPVRRTVRLCLCPLKVYTFWGLIAGIKVVALAWSGGRVRCDAMPLPMPLTMRCVSIY